jgi:hypothetical protein
LNTLEIHHGYTQVGLLKLMENPLQSLKISSENSVAVAE